MCRGSKKTVEKHCNNKQLVSKVMTQFQPVGMKNTGNNRDVSVQQQKKKQFNITPRHCATIRSPAKCKKNVFSFFPPPQNPFSVYFLHELREMHAAFGNLPSGRPSKLPRPAEMGAPVFLSLSLLCSSQLKAVVFPRQEEKSG